MWTWLVPALSFGLLLIAGVVSVGPPRGAVRSQPAWDVIAAVHHAEVTHIVSASRLPRSCLHLRTVIEASLILSMMIAGGDEMATLPGHHLRGYHDHLQRRDRYLSARWRPSPIASRLCRRPGRHGRSSMLTLAMPAFTTTTTECLQHVAALFVAVTSAALWVAFVSLRPFLIATTSFLCRTLGDRKNMPSRRQRVKRGSVLSIGTALVSVGLAKVLSPSIEGGRGCRHPAR